MVAIASARASLSPPGVRFCVMGPVYPCPCCGYVVFDEPPGSYDICPICFWEDDISQLRFVEMGGGANRASLVEAQRNYASFGCSERRLLAHVRPPSASELRDPGWRAVDVASEVEPGRAAQA
jgi:hypothetical protein